jgi:hypothetical protein
LQETGDGNLCDPFDAPDPFSVFVVHSCLNFVFVSNCIRRIHFKNCTNKPNLLWNFNVDCLFGLLSDCYPGIINMTIVWFYEKFSLCFMVKFISVFNIIIDGFKFCLCIELYKKDSF